MAIEELIMGKYENEINNPTIDSDNEIHIINDNSNMVDYTESNRSNIIIGSFLFGLSFLCFDLVYKNAEDVINTGHTTRSLEAIKAALSFLAPITLFSGGLVGICSGLYNYFKEKNQQKKLTLRKE